MMDRFLANPFRALLTTRRKTTSSIDGQWADETPVRLETGASQRRRAFDVVKADLTHPSSVLFADKPVGRAALEVVGIIAVHLRFGPSVVTFPNVDIGRGIFGPSVQAVPLNAFGTPELLTIFVCRRGENRVVTVRIHLVHLYMAVVTRPVVDCFALRSRTRRSASTCVDGG